MTQTQPVREAKDNIVRKTHRPTQNHDRQQYRSIRRKRFAGSAKFTGQTTGTLCIDQLPVIGTEQAESEKVVTEGKQSILQSGLFAIGITE